MLKKIEYTKNNLLNKKIENIFMCPICYNDIKIHNNSLICKNGHCYDISKKGYFTLLKKNKLRIDNIYDINLFKNRMEFIKKGYYYELHKLISKIIIEKDNSQIIVDVLQSDDDGIIPLTKNVGEEYLYGRIENALYKLGFNEAQFSSLDGFLGKHLKQYLEDNFFADFADHLNIFQNLPKTPFIWHITSGKEKAFECFDSIYKWSRDNLMRLRSVYVEHRERSLINRESDLLNNNSAQAQAEKAQIKLQLEELKEFKNKIDDLLASGYDPKLDDGVGKNIAPLQKRKMLSYEVLNAGQLKKYLNADW